MIQVRIECTYCGFVEIDKRYSKGYSQSWRCTKCGDKHLRVKEYSPVDYYEGCPPFEEEIPESYDPY